VEIEQVKPLLVGSDESISLIRKKKMELLDQCDQVMYRNFQSNWAIGILPIVITLFVPA